MSLSGDEEEYDVEAGEVPKPSMLRRAKTGKEEDAGPTNVQPQVMRRRKTGGGSNTVVVWTLLAFVVMVVLTWWGLMTAVMGSNKIEPHRVTPTKNAKQIIEQTEGLEWDRIYAAHAKQIGWVLEDRGELLNIGFPDGTTKWYPAEAVTPAVKSAERKKRPKKHKKIEEDDSEEHEKVKKEGEEEKKEDNEDVQKEIHVLDNEAEKHHGANDAQEALENAESPPPARKHRRKRKRHNTDGSTEEHQENGTDDDNTHKHRGNEGKEAEDTESPSPAPRRHRRKKKKLDDNENGAEENEQDEHRKPVEEDDNIPHRHRRHKKTDTENSEEPSKDSDKEKKEEEQEDKPTHKRRKRKKHLEEAHEEKDGDEEKKIEEEDTPPPHKRRRKKHVENGVEEHKETDGSEETSHKKHVKKHKKGKTRDALSLGSNIPKHKETCTYPSLHPHKWAEKFGWGKKKEFPPCDEDSAFSSIKYRDAQYEKSAEVVVNLLDETALTFKVDEGHVLYSNGVDITDADVKKVTFTADGQKYVLKVNKAPYRMALDWSILDKLRTMLSTYQVHCTIPRPATITFDCSESAKVFGFHELPDSFFKKMQTTIDAEHRQNELKNLYTTDKMEHTTHNVEDNAALDLVEPYLVAVCGKRRTLHLNLPSQGIKPKKENKKKLNVLHVMFDSSSLAALIRGCPKITSALEDLNNKADSPSKVFTFKHLHAVSCCSPGNQIPMYSGRMNGEGSPFVKAEPRQESTNWLWNVAGKLGYNTFFSLDNCPDKSARDFQAWPSVDHRIVAPMCMAGVLLSHKEKPCLTSRPIDDYVFEGADQFWKMYPDSPKYAAMQLITPHEETEKLLIELDNPMSSLLHKLEKDGTLNNTAVVFFSDHGINFGRYASTHDGEIEKMFPFMHVVLPRWVDQSAISFDALRANQDALVTPYDMHQLVRELLYYPDKAPPYSIDEEDPSLPKPEQSHIVASMKTLKEYEKVAQHVVPHSRDCVAANIPPEFCTCIAWEEVSDKEKFDVQVNAVVKHHKEVLEGLDQCEQVELDTVTGIELQVWPVEYHPKEHPKAKKIWMAPNRDMLRIHYTLKGTSAQFEAIVSLVKDAYPTFDIAIATRLDAMTKKCGVTEKKSEILCVCKED